MLKVTTFSWLWLWERAHADAFCAQRLPRLPWIPRNSGFEKPLFFFDQKTGVFMATPTVWVSIFYTENVRINDNTDFYEHGFGRRAVGYGKPKDPSCVICNLHLIARSDLKFCYEENCLVCPCIDHTGFIKSNANGKTFPCLSNVSCRMQNLVYLIECRECGKQYVGQTSRPLRERILEHVRDIFHQRHTSLAIHINAHGSVYVMIYMQVSMYMYWKLSNNSPKMITILPWAWVVENSYGSPNLMCYGRMVWIFDVEIRVFLRDAMEEI